jgi:hypothetical protein
MRVVKDRPCIIAHCYRGGLWSPVYRHCLKEGAEKMEKSKKIKERRKGQKNGPAFYNDQLGENPAEGRMEKEHKEKRRK